MAEYNSTAANAACKIHVSTAQQASRCSPAPVLMCDVYCREAAVKAAAAKHVQLLLDLSATVREEWGALKALAVAELTHRELDMQVGNLNMLLGNTCRYSNCLPHVHL